MGYNMDGNTFRLPLVVKDRQEVLDLISDLRNALKRSERSGGAYGVYRKNEEGMVVFAVEIHVPPRQSRKGATEKWLRHIQSDL